MSSDVMIHTHKHSTSCSSGKLLKADEASLHQTQAFQSPRGITETPPRAQRPPLCGISRHKYPSCVRLPVKPGQRLLHSPCSRSGHTIPPAACSV